MKPSGDVLLIVCLSQGDDDVYLCVMDGQTVDINPGYNRGRSHTEVASAVITGDQGDT